MGFGYASILSESTESDGFAGPIIHSQISSKKMADTRYCGPPFLLFLGYLDIWPKSPVMVSMISVNISSYLISHAFRLFKSAAS
jgi:hypothetical protein